MKAFDQFISYVIRNRLPVILISVLITLLCSVEIIRNMAVDNSLSIWFLDNNPDYKNYIAFQEEQGSDEIIIAAIPVEDPFDQQIMEKLVSCHEQVDSLDYVSATFSLANMKYPVYASNRINYSQLYDPRRSVKGMTSILDKIPVVKDQLISSDGKHSLFYVQLKSTSEVEPIRDEAVLKVNEILEAEFGSGFYYSGAPVLNKAYNETVYGESTFFAFLTVLVIIVILVFFLARTGHILMAMLAVIIPVVWLFGLLTAAGFKLNMISMLIPTVLMVYGVSDAIHIINIIIIRGFK